MASSSSALWAPPKLEYYPKITCCQNRSCYNKHLKKITDLHGSYSLCVDDDSGKKCLKIKLGSYEGIYELSCIGDVKKINSPAHVDFIPVSHELQKICETNGVICYTDVYMSVEELPEDFPFFYKYPISGAYARRHTYFSRIEYKQVHPERFEKVDWGKAKWEKVTLEKPISFFQNDPYLRYTH